MSHPRRAITQSALISGILIVAIAADVTAQSAKLTRNDLLVSSDWVATQLDNPKLVLLHVGEKPGYDAEHIPGARFFHIVTVAATRTRETDTTELALELPPIDELRQRLQAIGISDDSRIVVYWGKDWLSPSTRVMLTLQWAGLGGQVSLLDGGLPAWKKGNHPVTTDVPAPARPGRLSARPTVPLFVEADFVNAHIRTPGYTIVDARNTVFFDGPIQKPEGTTAAGGARDSIVPGHVPGAVSLVYASVVDESYRLLPEARLRELFAKAGVKPNDTVVAYCHVGQQATAVLFAARTLGYDIRLYDGSFQDWLRRKLPVEHSRKDGQ